VAVDNLEYKGTSLTFKNFYSTRRRFTYVNLTVARIEHGMSKAPKLEDLAIIIAWTKGNVTCLALAADPDDTYLYLKPYGSGETEIIIVSAPPSEATL
jgi:hypothetical protein